MTITAKKFKTPEFFQVANGTALHEYWTQEFLVATHDVYEDGENVDKYYFTFRVKEFYRDDEDFFGHPITVYSLICERRHVSGIHGWEEESAICLGEEFVDADAAKEFAINYVIPSFQRNLNFRACPVIILDPQY